MQIDLVDTYLDLMETLSFNRTAERLGVTQSTVSARIRTLEASVGRTLFARSRSGTQATTAGRRFRSHALALRQEWTEARRAIGAEAGAAGQLRLGIQNDLVGAYIGPLLSGLQTGMPGTAFYFEVDYSNQMSADVLAGELDVALLYTPGNHPDLHVEAVGTVRYRMVSTEADSLRNIAPSHYIRANYSAAFDREHRSRHPALRDAPVATGHNGAMCGLLAATGGSAYVLEASARALAADARFRIVRDAEPIMQTVHGTVHLRRRHLSTVREALRIAARTLGEAGRTELDT